MDRRMDSKEGDGVMYDLFCDNFDSISPALKHKLTYDFNRFLALSYTVQDRTFDPEEFGRLVRSLKKQTSVFSPFRSMFGALILSRIGQTGNAEEELKRLLAADKRLERRPYRHLARRPFLALAMTRTEEGTLEKSEAIYQAFRKAHPWLTNGDDRIAALLLADLDESETLTVDRVESFHEALLRAGQTRTNDLQLAAQLLALTKLSPETAVERIGTWQARLKREKIGLTLAHLPLLALAAAVEDSFERDMNTVKIFADRENSRRRFNKPQDLAIAFHLVIARRLLKDADQLAYHERGDLLLEAQHIALLAAATAVYEAMTE